MGAFLSPLQLNWELRGGDRTSSRVGVSRDANRDLGCWMRHVSLCQDAQGCGVVLVTGWPRLLWFVTDGKHVVKPPKDWSPPMQEASNDMAYIEVGSPQSSGYVQE